MPIGIPELIIILVIALLILGPGKLPEVGASLGKGIREFRKASTDIQDSVKLDAPPATPGQPSQSAAPVAAPPPVAAAPTEPSIPTAPPEATSSEPVASGSASSADPATRAD
jgi:TatA/E family protein of Tat protein translocase